MKNIVKIILAATLLLALGSSTANADINKGMKYYVKKLKKPCGFSGAKFAASHTQDEWIAIGKAGIADEIRKLCPKVNDKALKEKYLEHYYDFALEYGSDSGTEPAC